MLADVIGEGLVGVSLGLGPYNMIWNWIYYRICISIRL